MSDVPPPKNAFDVMMASLAAPKVAVEVAEGEEDEPVLTAVLYEAHLEDADESEPLWRVPYFGQAVRLGTAEAIFAARKRRHERDAARGDKDIGFHAVIDRFGDDAIAWRIVSFKSGRRSEMQAYANAEEIRLIDENGGMLRDMDAKLEQTLNLTKGGQGDARVVWATIDARRRRALTKFKVAMEKYVEEHRSSLVPSAYVDEDKYPLGLRLCSFRKGALRKGMPEEAAIDSWAEALPKWLWNARGTDELFEQFQRGNIERSRGAFAKFKSAMEAYVEKHGSALVPQDFIAADRYPLGLRLSSFRRGRMHKGLPEEAAIDSWAVALPKWSWNAKDTDEWREEKRKQITERHTTERRDELKRARPIAVPFEKNLKRRIAMRAASTDFSGVWSNAVLYMVSEDKKTIRRVAKNGNMSNRCIVGPVVDPPPPDAFDSDSD